MYAFLERLGFGFYLGGDAFADVAPPRLSDDLDISSKPAFAVRGSLPWYNFLNSPTTWDRDDYRYFFDQMAKMRMNFVGFHSYDNEPFCAYPWEGKLAGGEPLVTTLNYNRSPVWGMKTAEFGFGTGDFFFGPVFGSQATIAWTGREDAIRRAQATLADGLHYARSRGLKVCVGFEVWGDPTKTEAQERLRARLEAMLHAYPMLDYVWLWQSEGLGGGSELAQSGSPLALMVDRYTPEFQYLGNPRRVHEAVRIMLYARLGHAMLKRLAPRVPLVVSGWGGDRWMRFGDFYTGLDRTLPGDVIFAALDNIDPSVAPTVAAVYGKLPPTRSAGRYRGGKRTAAACAAINGGRSATPGRSADLPRRPGQKMPGHVGHSLAHPRRGGGGRLAGTVRLESATQLRTVLRRLRRSLLWAALGRRNGRDSPRTRGPGPRYTGGLGQTECGPFCWFDKDRKPKPENLAKLAALRARIAAVRQSMKEKWQVVGLERIDWLLTTIDWLTRYDAAAVLLCKGGEVDRLLTEAESKKQAGDHAAARALAGKAAERFNNCGLPDALRPIPGK